MLVDLLMAGLLVVLGLVLGWRTLQNPQRISLRDVFLLSSLVYFPIGWVVSYVLLNSQAWVFVSRDYGFVFLTIALYILGFWAVSRPLVGKNNLDYVQLRNCLPEPFLVSPFLILILYLAVWLMRAYRALVFGIFFSGTASEEAVLRLPYYFVILYSLASMVGQGCTLWAALEVFGRKKRYGSYVKLVSVVVIVGEVLWSLTQGRRWFLSLVLLLGVGYAVSGGRLRFKFIVATGAVAILFFSVISPVFLSVRNHYDRENPSAIDALSEAVSEVAVQGGDKDSSTSNVALRSSSVSEFSADLFRLQETRGAMFGQALAGVMSKAIPSVFLPGKYSQLAGEQLIQAHYRIPLGDTAISLPAVAIADFGVVGGLIYGAGLGVYVFFICRISFSQKDKRPFLVFVLVAGLISNLFFVEEDPVVFLLLVRNLVVLYIVSRIFSIMFGRLGIVRSPQMDRNDAGKGPLSKR